MPSLPYSPSALLSIFFPHCSFCQLPTALINGKMENLCCSRVDMEWWAGECVAGHIFLYVGTEQRCIDKLYTAHGKPSSGYSPSCVFAPSKPLNSFLQTSLRNCQSGFPLSDYTAAPCLSPLQRERLARDREKWIYGAGEVKHTLCESFISTELEAVAQHEWHSDAPLITQSK